MAKYICMYKVGDDDGTPLIRRFELCISRSSVSHRGCPGRCKICTSFSRERLFAIKRSLEDGERTFRRRGIVSGSRDAHLSYFHSIAACMHLMIALKGREVLNRMRGSR
jgi:hypothetical protein